MRQKNKAIVGIKGREALCPPKLQGGASTSRGGQLVGCAVALEGSPYGGMPGGGGGGCALRGGACFAGAPFRFPPPLGACTAGCCGA